MDKKKPLESSYEKNFQEQIARKETRRLKGRRQKQHGFWYGLGLFGIVGWSVMVPFLICVSMGLVIDAKWPSRISWTLTLLIVGIALGCLNAWFWVEKERKRIEKDHYEG